MDMKRLIFREKCSPEELFCAAQEIALFSSNLASSQGNAAVLFALFALERRLASMLCDPNATLTELLLVTDSIAVLTETIRSYNPPLTAT